MDYATNPDADNTHPNRHDYEELALIYSHLDGSTAIGSSPKGAGAARVTHRPPREVDDRPPLRGRFGADHLHHQG
jgi:hypothetical protein